MPGSTSSSELPELLGLLEDELLLEPGLLEDDELELEEPELLELPGLLDAELEPLLALPLELSGLLEGVELEPLPAELLELPGLLEEELELPLELLEPLLLGLSGLVVPLSPEPFPLDL